MLTSKEKTSCRHSHIFLVFYIVFGVAHELVHWMVAYFLGLSVGVNPLQVILGAVFARACYLPAVHDADDWQVALIRHLGWFFSCWLAIGLSFFSNDPYMKTAAWTTAVEALTTDLFQVNVQKSMFFCGNFGIVMVNSKWIEESGNFGLTALDILEKMIYVTMMRGAQTGGVVAWAAENNTFTGIRSRVVNGKRDDLSKGLRRKVEQDTFRFGRIKHGIRAFWGHTRFATSSKATFGGTHPHRWTPPQPRRVYLSMMTKLPKPTIVKVENYITHNGDLDFFKLSGKHYDLEKIQEWLPMAMGAPLPDAVDSICIAGFIDLLRTAGCFGLSLRYALLIASKNSTMEIDPCNPIPSYEAFEELGMAFEEQLTRLCDNKSVTLMDIKKSSELRQSLSEKVLFKITKEHIEKSPLSRHISLGENAAGASFPTIVRVTVDAFFDNDLFYATRLFLKRAVGSFGLMVTSSLDASRQICIAARGQPMSVAFYPKKGLVCYGSELGAVKAGLNFPTPGGYLGAEGEGSSTGLDTDTLRLDLDDLGGEVCLIDWGKAMGLGRLVVKQGTRLRQQSLMSGTVEIAVYEESKITEGHFYSRMTLLEGNEHVNLLPSDSKDLVLDDIRAIPNKCSEINESWKNPSLNRFTAWSLMRCIRRRLSNRMEGKILTHAGTVDLLVTGCEVSLWVAEQFASDLQKIFPKLYIQSISSNKLLGVFGQQLKIPSVGFPVTEGNPDLQDAIVIIVSHSGGTFAPLACSSLLQSMTKNIFVVTSEWDTQIGKQVRSIHNSCSEDIYTSRIFITDIGLRPAEPCSLSVVATHQFLTNLLMHICANIIRDAKFRNITGALITDYDVKALARCTEDSTVSLHDIIWGNENEGSSNSRLKLIEIGDLWSEHVLENAKAYIMSFVYVFVTVVTGFPIITAIATAAGLKTVWVYYIVRFFDAVIYFFLPQINIILLRLVQGRHLRHRMVGRTVVIGDIPWVAQCAEAFLSKLFACSYSIAGLNVLSGNPTDHLVHRHTHRVVRGTLLICGRPDGRLEALTNSECTVCLSVNQASSIQSLGGACESITIGHNPYQLSLTKRDIFLPTHRPQFICERLIEEQDREEMTATSIADDISESKRSIGSMKKMFSRSLSNIQSECGQSSVAAPISRTRSSHALKGLYSSWRNKSTTGTVDDSVRACLNTTRHRTISALWMKQALPEDSYSKSNVHGLAECGLEGNDVDKKHYNNRRNNAIGSLGSRIWRILFWKQHEPGFNMDASPSSELQHSSHLARYFFDGDSTMERKADQLLNRQKAALVIEKDTIEQMIKERQSRNRIRQLFDTIDADKSGTIEVEEFIEAFTKEGILCKSVLVREGVLRENEAKLLFQSVDKNCDGAIQFDEFTELCRSPQMNMQVISRDCRGLSQIEPNKEEYFGAKMRQNNETIDDQNSSLFAFSQTQNLLMELYESRVASMERFVAMCVMFHHMAMRVQQFFATLSFGVFGYRMDRTHSIMRIATTASPISGADVRQRMETLRERMVILESVQRIELAWAKYQQKKFEIFKKESIQKTK